MRWRGQGRDPLARRPARARRDSAPRRTLHRKAFRTGEVRRRRGRPRRESPAVESIVRAGGGARLDDRRVAPARRAAAGRGRLRARGEKREPRGPCERLDAAGGLHPVRAGGPRHPREIGRRGTSGDLRHVRRCGPGAPVGGRGLAGPAMKGAHEVREARVSEALRDLLERGARGLQEEHRPLAARLIQQHGERDPAFGEPALERPRRNAQVRGHLVERTEPLVTADRAANAVREVALVAEGIERTLALVARQPQRRAVRVRQRQLERLSRRTRRG